MARFDPHGEGRWDKGSVQPRTTVTGFPGPYNENPGLPTEEELGIYCPHGIKIVEAGHSAVPDEVPMTVVDPWPCERSGCTLEAFERAQAAAEAEYLESMRPGMWE